jgi:hypothetical protein
MNGEAVDTLTSFIGMEVVIDLASPFVCLGRLVGVEEHFLSLADADLHDLRDTKTTRENYVIAAVHTGIKRNRRRVLISRREVVAVGRAKDVVAD